MGIQSINTKYILIIIQQERVKALIDLKASSNFISKETIKYLEIKY